ncbi:hypothetical protein Tco_1119810, partial [Tanacetum coccineum]
CQITVSSAHTKEEKNYGSVHIPKADSNAETGIDIDRTNNGGDTEILQFGDKQDPGETHESRPPLKQVFMDEEQAGPNPGVSGVALARLDPEPTHDEFMADLYPKVQESLKFLAE